MTCLANFVAIMPSTVFGCGNLTKHAEYLAKMFADRADDIDELFSVLVRGFDLTGSRHAIVVIEH